MNKKFIIILSLFSITLGAMQDASEWVDAKITAQVQELIEREQPLIVPKEEELGQIRLGVNWAGINHLQWLCLKDIHHTFLSHHQVPVPVIDIGAGFGLMSWKMIAAGAEVIAFSNSCSLIEQINRSVAENFRELSLKDVSIRVYPDFMRINENIISRFQVAWSGQNLHLYDPSQVDDYVHKIFLALKPGGRVYLTTLTPSYDPVELEHYRYGKYKTFLKEDQSEYDKFPGYLMHNLLELRYRNPDYSLVKEYRLVNSEFLHPVLSFKPEQRNPGFWGQPKLSDELRMWVSPKTKNVFFKQFHVATHKFDDDTMKMVFERAGFIVNDIFYFDLSDNFAPMIRADQFTPRMRAERRWGIGIKATKPRECEEKVPERKGATPPQRFISYPLKKERDDN